MSEALFNPTELLKVLDDLAKDIRDNYKEHLAFHDRKASGDLLNSVTTRVEVNGAMYEVWMSLEDYWQYVENDTRPHWAPKAAIDRWIRIKPVIPQPDERGHIPTPEQLSYLIRRKIAREGTEGSHDLRDTEAAVLPMYRERISEALGRDCYNFLKKVLPEMD